MTKKASNYFSDTLALGTREDGTMGKQDDFFRTQIRIPSDVYEAIKLSAEESGRSVNAEMVHLMSAALGMKEPVPDLAESRIRELIREELTKAGK
uniref:Arc family DNA-binding protein n=2 Tax=Thiothrix fructosivorans TaxID=111770 RepID=A0A8B0SHX8_9GAMM|nr:Arc family DNA-binding protein [Thiothrix fructosivorans]